MGTSATPSLSPTRTRPARSSTHECLGKPRHHDRHDERTYLSGFAPRSLRPGPAEYTPNLPTLTVSGEVTVTSHCRLQDGLSACLCVARRPPNTRSTDRDGRL